MEVKGKYEDMSPVPVQSQENPYELVDINTNVRRDGAQPTEVAIQNKSSKQSTWNTPSVVMTILLCLIVFLLVVILCLLLVQLSDRNASSTTTSTTGAVASNIASPNFTEWSDNIVNKVNSNVTQSLPDFNKWANRVVSKVNSNVIQSLPDFNEWVNGVVSKVKQQSR